MQIFKNPERKSWGRFMKRPLIENTGLESAVREIISNVKMNGDTALLSYAEKFDAVKLKKLKVSKSEIEDAEMQIPESLKTAIGLAAGNIRKFHESQISVGLVVETMPGVRCWRKNTPIENVGLYIPGGSASLFSTVLMLAIPASIAGCKNAVICTPPLKDGSVDPVILYTAALCGVKTVYKAGGAQAIAAMAVGTETIPIVDKIFGPGNQWVTKAKEIVQAMGTAIDMPAGPSEVLVIADETARPDFVAADLLSQAEHGPDSQEVFLTTSKNLLYEVSVEIQKQLAVLPRKDIAREGLKNSYGILLQNVDVCMDFSNNYAPEHLIIATEDPNRLAEKVINAGSVFLGNFSCESAGDYASGTNHTLPTNGFAKSYSGISVDSFLKKITFQQIDKKGIQNLGPTIEIMASAEQLDAHKNAISIRLEAIKNE
jgi:histidinol dehydrogenase